MSICASGASQAKPGVASAVVVDQQYVQSILPAALAWLYPYLPYMSGLQIGNVAAFCALDPPTWTVPSAGDIFTFITGGAIGQAGAVQQFMQDITKAYIWYSLCQCSTGATPPAPTAPTAPTGLPAINPPSIVTPQPSTPCDTTQSSNVGWTANMSLFLGGTTPLARLNPTAIRVTSVRSVFTAPGPTFTMTLTQNLTNGVIIRTDTWTLPNTGTDVQIFPMAPGANGWQLKTVASGAAGTTAKQDTIDVFCNGNPPGGMMSPCCPPDPQQTGLLDQILQAVTLIQRQNVPFATIPGTAHAGLSGAGVLTISGLIGVRVDVTAYGSAVGLSGSAPTEYFSAGFLTFGTSDGYDTSWRIDHNPRVVFPPRCSAYTVVAYDLPTGVTITITELRREPS